MLGPVPATLLDAVGLFDGQHADTDLMDLVGPAWGEWLLTALTQHQAFAPTGTTPTRPVFQIAGGGALARHLAWGLRSIGDCRGPADPVSRRIAQAADVVILADDAVEADRVVARQLTRANQAHLVVTVSATTAQVGPFVIPALTSCLDCLDRTRGAHDPAWPLMVYQRMRLTATADPILAHWAVATAAAHLRAFADGTLPESASTSLTLDRSGSVTYTAWPRHPHCRQH